MGLDIRFALRALRRTLGFTTVALLTLALGIGAVTAMFSVFNGVLLRPLPYPVAERLVAIQEVVPSLARFGPSLPVSASHFQEWSRRSRSVDQPALLGAQAFTLTGEGDPVRFPAARVSASLFPLLHVQAALGRTFTAEEDQPGHDAVAVISHSLWNNRFHADPAIVGRNILLNGVPRQVIGVLPAGARIPTQGQLQSMQMNDAPAEIWVPFAIGPGDLAIMAEFNYGCIARLRPGVTIPQAIDDLNAIQSGIVKDLPEKVELRALITPLQEQMTGRSRQSLSLLLAASATVLAIVIVNLVNLLLARAVSRRREMAIRTAIGAGALRLMRQMLMESLLLAVAGGCLGLVAARWALAGVILQAPLDIPGLRDVRMDWQALAFAAVVTLLSGAICGVVPAWRVARTDPQSALQSGGRAVTEGRQGGRTRRTLVSAEVALSTICLVIGGLLLGSFVRLLQVDKGFQSDRAFTMGIGLPGSRYRDSGQRSRFIRTLLDQVQALPGVTAAGISNRGPLSGEGSNLGILAEGLQLPRSQWPSVDYRCVSPDFFHAMGIPLVAGRLIAESDGDRRVSVISAQTAHRLWPGRDPIGRHFHLGDPGDVPFEIVGIVGDVRTSLPKPPSMTVYVPFWQVSRSDLALVVRTAADSAQLASSVRTVIRGLDSQLVVPQVRTLHQVVDAAVAPRRFQLQLILLFAATALLLAAIGVYGVVSQSVTQRTNEIGIRMALGATRSDVRKLVSLQGMAPVLAGLAAGLVSAAIAARFVNGLLFQVRTVDPLAFGGTILVLAASAALACLIPANRATRVDPLIALRYE